MNRKALALCAAVVMVGVLWWALGRGKAVAAEDASSAVNRAAVELTVYAEDFGMVRETRPVSLAAGDNRLPVTDVSRRMDPRSVLLDWKRNAASGNARDAASGGDAASGVPTAASLPQIVAHTYDLGVANTGELLNRYLGRQVEVIRYGENGHEAERQKGALMVDSGGLALRSEGKYYINPAGTIVTPADAGVATIPQLSVQATSPVKQNASLDVAYLTRGLSWSADYVGTLQPDGRSLKLECWATVTNQTGVEYPNAKVSLVAGTPNRAVREDRATERPGSPRLYEAKALWKKSRQVMAAADNPRIPVGDAEAVGDFHAYPIKAATTVGVNRMNRLLMMSAPVIPAKMDYNTRAPQLDPWSDYYWGTPEQPKKGKVAVSMSFKNREVDGLGQPLPRGAMRIYEPDGGGTLRYGGAASIGDTPKNENIHLTLASSFDFFTEQRIVSRKRIDRRTTRKEVELTLHNGKAAPVDLRIVQPFGGSWKISSESHKHAKLNAYEVQWTVPLPAESVMKLRYAVDMR